jgi:hypothetical protein
MQKIAPVYYKNTRTNTAGRGERRVVGGDACAARLESNIAATSVQLDSLAGAAGCDVAVLHGIDSSPAVNSSSTM